MLRFLQGIFCFLVAMVMILCFFAEENNLGLAEAGQIIIQNTEEGRWPLDQTQSEREEIQSLFRPLLEQGK